MIVYNKYTNNQDHTWYDSSNVIYSKCYDNSEQFKTLKIVFSNGRTYLYKDVDVNDYVAFKLSESNGKTVNTHIVKKYKGVRITDTDVDKLNELKESFINEEQTQNETKLSNLLYHIDYHNDGNFVLKFNGKPIYHAKEGEVSILNLFKSMGISYTMNEVDELIIENDEEEDKIKLD